MPTNKEYQEKVEARFGKPLREVMYDLCVIRNVVPTEGAYELDVPKSTFNFRFGPNQIKMDKAEEKRKKDIRRYQRELEDIDLEREFKFNDKQSIDGLIEVIERLLELEKYKRTKVNQDSMADISLLMKIAALESTLDYIKKYTDGVLHQEYINELQFLKEK